MSVFYPTETSEKIKHMQSKTSIVLENNGISHTTGDDGFILLTRENYFKAMDVCKYDKYYRMN